jgi:hypothetical protein
MSKGSRKPAAPQAPVYYECPECGWLSSHPDFRDAQARKCERCHLHVADGARTFPTDRLRRLDDRIRTYQAGGETEIVVILVAAFLEAILEDILDRILTAHGADVGVRRVVMGSQRSISTRIGRVFPSLTGHEFEDVAAELGFRDFPHRWRVLREARNAFIHDSPFHGARETLEARNAEDAMRLLDQAYRLFVLVNNRYVAAVTRERLA